MFSVQLADLLYAEGLWLTRIIPRLTRINAKIKLGPTVSLSISIPLKITPKTGVKNENAWSRLTG